MNRDSIQELPAASIRLLVEDVGRVTLMLGALLPAVGVFARFVYLAAYTSVPLDLAVRAPLGDLTVGGVVALVPACAVLGYLGIAIFAAREPDHRARIEHGLGPRNRDTPARGEQRAGLLRSRKAALVLLFASAVAILASAMLIAPGWPVGWIPYGVWFVTWWAILRAVNVTGRVELGRLWWVLLGAAVAVGLSSGLQGQSNDTYVAYVSAPSASQILPAGFYEVVGDDDSSLYAIECAGAGAGQLYVLPRAATFVVVPGTPASQTATEPAAGHSASLTPRPIGGTSLFAILFQHGQVRIPTVPIC
jgi:hypothetical protein